MVDEERVSLLEGATVTADVVQRNRDPRPPLPASLSGILTKSLR